MMYHHDNRPYQEAASEAAKMMREKIGGLIEAGKRSGSKLIQHVDAQIIDDRVVPLSKLDFYVNAENQLRAAFDMRSAGGDRVNETLSRNALGQIATDVHLPMAYANYLLGIPEVGPQLLAENFNRLLHRSPDERRLTRSVEGQLKGYLSTKYKRIDPKPVLRMFLEACESVGAMPFDAKVYESKFMIRMLLMRMFEPVQNEVVAYGLSYESSQFGAGAENVSLFVCRCWCTNLAQLETPLRKVHLGARLPENIEWSQELVESESKTLSLAVRDVALSLLGPGNTSRLNDAIVQADSQKMSGRQVEAFIEGKLLKGDGERVVELFSSADIENLPPGQTAWRLSNAISWYASEVQDDEKKLELSKVAGQLLKAKIAA